MKPYDRMAGGPMTVEQLEARLRRLVPRLGPRDRTVILDAVQAIKDLARELHQEKERNAKTTVRFEEPLRLRQP